MLVWRRGILKKNTLCYGIVYYYNGEQRYEQFLQVVRLYRALNLLSLALSSKCLCVFSLHGAFLLSLPFNELSVVKLALDLVD